MSSDEDVTVTAGRGRQAAIVVIRNGVNPSAHIPVENVILAKPGFILGSQPVALSKPYRWMVMVLVVPLARGLPIVVVESRMNLGVLVVTILVVMVLLAMILVVAVLIVAILILPSVLCVHGMPG